MLTCELELHGNFIKILLCCAVAMQISSESQTIIDNMGTVVISLQYLLKQSYSYSNKIRA